MRAHASLFLLLVLSACSLTPLIESLDSTSSLSRLYGKKLQNGDTYLLINPDGSVSGIMNERAFFGSWDITDGFWCPTITVGPQKAIADITGCQQLALIGSELKSTQRDNTQNTTTYKIM